MALKEVVTRVALVMAGGSGERFWPLSRQRKPKQLLRLTSPDRSMLAESVDRLSGVIPPENVYVITAQHLVAPILDAGIGIPDENVLSEPCKRNTSGALAYATASLLKRYKITADKLSIAVVTADHHIEKPEMFCETVRSILDAVEEQDALGVLGVVPTRPETGYGYIQIAEPVGGTGLYKVRAFHEKPNTEKAEEFMATGRYFWNSGMFFWKASTFLSELDHTSPALSASIRQMASAMASDDSKSVRTIFEALDDISIDYALMEHAKHVIMARADFPWDDVGSLPALERSYPKDAKGNVCVGDPIILDAQNCIVYNEPGAENVAVSVIGVEDLVVVVTRDAVLVAPKDRAQDVRHAVAELKRRGAKQV